MLDSPNRSFVGRALRSRWFTIPLRLIGGIFVVGATSGFAQSVSKGFRPGPDQLMSAPGLTANLAIALFVAVMVMLVYVVFVRLTERRWPSELRLRPALWEVPSGIVLGLGGARLAWPWSGFLAAIRSIASRIARHGCP